MIGFHKFWKYDGFGFVHRWMIYTSFYLCSVCNTLTFVNCEVNVYILSQNSLFEIFKFLFVFQVKFVYTHGNI